MKPERSRKSRNGSPGPEVNLAATPALSVRCALQSAGVDAQVSIRAPPTPFSVQRSKTCTSHVATYELSQRGAGRRRSVERREAKGKKWGRGDRVGRGGARSRWQPNGMQRVDL